MIMIIVTGSLSIFTPPDFGTRRVMFIWSPTEEPLTLSSLTIGTISSEQEEWFRSSSPSARTSSWAHWPDGDQRQDHQSQFLSLIATQHSVMMRSWGPSAAAVANRVRKKKSTHERGSKGVSQSTVFRPESPSWYKNEEKNINGWILTGAQTAVPLKHSR